MMKNAIFVCLTFALVMTTSVAFGFGSYGDECQQCLLTSNSLHWRLHIMSHEFKKCSNTHERCFFGRGYNSHRRVLSYNDYTSY